MTLDQGDRAIFLKVKAKQKDLFQNFPYLTAMDEVRKEVRKEKAALINRQNYAAYCFRDIHYPKVTAEEYFRWIQQNARACGFPLRITEANKDIIKALALYFSKDYRAEGYGLDLEKGLIIFGGIGCGKTYTMKAVRTNPSAAFLLVPCSDISDAYTQDGVEALEKYATPAKGRPNPFNGDTQYGWCYDDLGTEETSSNYGNRRNVMAEVIQKAYNRPDLKGRIHITTNLDPDQIEAIYGPRVRSRMREMFNQLAFPDEIGDLRK
ncbi:ATPase [Siphonobacter sp. BAB-5405]|nr:ATPase [Siphonobacter sp. BAB-5405]